jgi:hypothetical protein
MNFIRRILGTVVSTTIFFAITTQTAFAADWELSGTRSISLHGRDGSKIVIGSIDFTGPSDDTRFKIALDHHQLKDYFLSMREFKCREGGTEIFCHVPYPYPHPGRISLQNLAWLEHSLLFFFKLPRDFGAKLWNGVYFKLVPTDHGLVGTAQAVDLNQIGAPPSDPTTPPFAPTERSDITPGSRWFEKLSIE